MTRPRRRASTLRTVATKTPTNAFADSAAPSTPLCGHHARGWAGGALLIKRTDSGAPALVLFPAANSCRSSGNSRLIPTLLPLIVATDRNEAALQDCVDRTAFEERVREKVRATRIATFAATREHTRSTQRGGGWPGWPGRRGGRRGGARGGGGARAAPRQRRCMPLKV